MVKKVPYASFGSNEIIGHNDYCDYFDYLNNAGASHEYVPKFASSLLSNLSTCSRGLISRLEGGNSMYARGLTSCIRRVNVQPFHHSTLLEIVDSLQACYHRLTRL